MTHATPEAVKYRRRLKWPLILVGFVLFFWGWGWLNKHILPVRRYGPLNSTIVELNFNKPFPTDKDIESYLSNATILLSRMSFGQSVYYFDAPHHFLQWRNDGTNRADLLNGEWFTTPLLLPMTYNGRWRLALVYSFCKWFPDQFEEMPADSCIVIEDLNQLFTVGSAVREYRAGNVFDLSVGEPAPFPLPNSRRITIDGLLAEEREAASRRPPQ